jgi:primosomal protein N' (replication factor Y)
MSRRLVQVVFPTPVDQSYTYEVPDGLSATPGCRVVAPFGRRSQTGFVIEAETPADITWQVKPIVSVLDEAPLFDREIQNLAAWTASMYFCSHGEALAAFLPGAKQERDFAVDSPDGPLPDPAGIVLSDEQERSVADICVKPDGMNYLYGLTGSGKTEVFMQVARRTLDEGRNVIYLVPEIALTRQVIHAIEARFPGLTAVLHSRLTPSQRLMQWRRIQRGEARLVIGARSAVFAPVRDLGLVVIDEEHETSYKSGTSPRYHARQIAMRRCLDRGARLIMGSATPSAEAWHLMREGRLAVHRLNRRLAGGGMPEIRVIPVQGNETSLSQELLSAMRETHAMGKQTILFLNRRGFAYFFFCRSCHWEMGCTHCSVGMTYHKNRNMMVCHYCGRVARPISVCPECGSLDVGYAGFGTEKVEEDVARLFPDLRVSRIDTDSIRRKGSLEKTIDDFRQGRIDILLGTQMVAKGLNFPGVRLVGIVNADMGLHLPDFRSAERTFSLITQVAGRAGRYADNGLVLIQTYKPEAQPIRLASLGSIEEYYAWELEQRRLQDFPPFSRLVRLVFRSAQADKSLHAAKEFLLANGRRLKPVCEVLGPSECALARVNNSSRYQILLVTHRFAALHDVLEDAFKAWRDPSGVYLEIDTDPVSLL